MPSAKGCSGRLQVSSRLMRATSASKADGFLKTSCNECGCAFTACAVIHHL